MSEWKELAGGVTSVGGDIESLLVAILQTYRT